LRMYSEFKINLPLLCAIFFLLGHCTYTAFAEEAELQNSPEQALTNDETENHDSTKERARHYRIGVSGGVTFAGYTEGTDTQINRYMIAPTVILDSNIEKNRFLHHINLLFFMGKAHPARKVRHLFPEEGYMSYRAAMEYALDYRLWSLGGNPAFPGWLGGTFRADFYFFTDYINILRLSMLFSLGVHVTQKWIINPRHSLSVSLGIPLLTYAIRSPYSGLDDRLIAIVVEDAIWKILGMGNFASVHNYLAIFGDIKYHFKLTPLLSFYSGLGLEFSHINIPKGRGRRDAASRLNAGLVFTF